MGAMLRPSVKARTLTSGPVKHSSITISLPESPKALSSMMDLTAASASGRSWGMSTPLPRARPSALMTMGKEAVFK